MVLSAEMEVKIKMKKIKYRIKLTTRCNLSCSYCINKNSLYKERWNVISEFDDVTFSDCRSIIISGGEPTILESFFLRNTLRAIKWRAGEEIPMYLQTNGTFLTKKLVKLLDDCIDGIGLSIHNKNSFCHLYTRYRDIKKIKPIRLYVSKDMNMKLQSDFLLDRALRDGFSVKTWSNDEFDASEKILLYTGKVKYRDKL